MQHCDATCSWCARHFFAWLRDRMFSAQRDGGRSGGGSFADAAATSVRPNGAVGLSRDRGGQVDSLLV